MAESKIKLVSNAPLYLDVRKLLGEILDVTPEFPRSRYALTLSIWGFYTYWKPGTWF